MNKKTIMIIAACLLVAAGGGFWLWSRKKKRAKGTEPEPEKITSLSQIDLSQGRHVDKIGDITKPPAGIDLAPDTVEVVEEGDKAEIVETKEDREGKDVIVLDNGTEITKPDGVQLLSDGTLVLGTLERGIRVPQSLISRYSHLIPESAYDVDQLYYPTFDTHAEMVLYRSANSHKRVGM